MLVQEKVTWFRRSDIRPLRAALLCPLAGEHKIVARRLWPVARIFNYPAEGVIGVSADRGACIVNNEFFPGHNDNILKS